MSSDEKYLDELLKQMSSDREAELANQNQDNTETDTGIETETVPVNESGEPNDDPLEFNIDDMLRQLDESNEEPEAEDVSVSFSMNDNSIDFEMESASSESASPDQELSDLLKILEAESHEELSEESISADLGSQQQDSEPLLDDHEDYSIAENEEIVKNNTANVVDVNPDDVSFDHNNADSDIAALFSMGEEEDDEELAEINELLKKDENHELVEDDEMLLMLSKAEQNASNSDSDQIMNHTESDEIVSTKKSKQKKEKKPKKSKNKLTENDDSTQNDQTKKEKKPSFIRKILDALMEADEDEESETDQVKPVSDENLQLLDELEQEDQKGKKKKAPKEKKKKEKAPKKPKKEKQPKKEKVKKEAIPEKPEKKIPRRNIIAVIALSASFLAGILIFAILIPTNLNISKAYEANDKNDYQEVFRLLAGEKLNEDDQEILTKAKIVLEVERKFDSYQNHKKLGMELEAINDLFQGIKKYNELYDYAQQYSVGDKITEIYQMILQTLSAEYDLAEEDVMTIIEYDKVLYTKKINSIIYGTAFDDPSVEKSEEEPLQDMLPEESEFEQPQDQPQDQETSMSDNDLMDQEQENNQEQELFSGTVSSGSVDFSKSGIQGESE